MIKKSLQTALTAFVLLGCASDSNPSQESPTQASPVAPPAGAALGAAFFGLTVNDCYASAADCFEGITDPATWASEAAACRAQLQGCFGDVVEEAVTTVGRGATEIVQCSDDGLTCVGEAHEFDAVVACRESVEACVNGTVKEVTGVELPSTKQILDATVEVSHAVVEAKTEVVESTVGTAVAVTDVTATAVEGTVNAAIDVAGAVVTSAQSLLDCAVGGHVCMLDTADFLACGDAYQTCITAVP